MTINTALTESSVKVLGSLSGLTWRGRHFSPKWTIHTKSPFVNNSCPTPLAPPPKCHQVTAMHITVKESDALTASAPTSTHVSAVVGATRPSTDVPAKVTTTAATGNQPSMTAIPPTTNAPRRPNPSPINVAKLSKYLDGYYNKQFIISGLTEGFSLQFQGPQTSLASKNSESITEFHHIVEQKLEKELKLGRISGPYVSPPFPNFKVSLLSLIPKQTPGKYRLIHNLSYPYDLHSVNYNIPSEYTTVTYQTLQHALSLIQFHSPTAYLAKTDIADAFRIIPLHPDQYNLLGFSFNSHYYFDKMLCMGAAKSCRFFEDFSNALVWILHCKFHLTSIVKVLDAFYLFSLPTIDANVT